MGIRAMTERHRQAISAAARRVWADPETRAAQIEAIRLVTEEDAAAIVAACRAEPRRQYKLIAYEFCVSPSTVNAIALAAGIRRQAPRYRPRIYLKPPAMKEAA